MPERRKLYSVVSHDGWGSTSVGEFESLEEAQELFRLWNARCLGKSCLTWFLGAVMQYPMEPAHSLRI